MSQSVNASQLSLQQLDNVKTQIEEVRSSCSTRTSLSFLPDWISS